MTAIHVPLGAAAQRQFRRCNSVLSDAPFLVAHGLGAIPLLAVMLARPHGRAYWGVAFALFVSFVADWCARTWGQWPVSVSYPIAQVGIIAAAILTRKEVLGVALVCTVAAVSSVYFFGVESPDVLVRIIAFSTAVGIAVECAPYLDDRLTASLIVYFGAGLVAWLFYVMDPGWWSWCLYQCTRLAGILLFCASMRPERRPEMVRA